MLQISCNADDQVLKIVVVRALGAAAIFIASASVIVKIWNGRFNICGYFLWLNVTTDDVSTFRRHDRYVDSSWLLYFFNFTYC